MLNITRYINGKKVDFEELQNYTIENDIVLNIIKEVNRRVNKTKQQLQNEPKGT